MDTLEACRRELENNIIPSRTMKYFNIEFDGDEIKLIGTNIIFKGCDINMHLRECTACALFAVTLGHKADSLIKKTQLEDMAKAVILDRLSDNAVTELLNEVYLQIKTDKLFVTNIFSPGCGDFELSYQNRILNVLDAYKRCGIGITQSSFMIPVKSMTGVVGISQKKVTGMPRGCVNCNQQDCLYERYGG